MYGLSSGPLFSGQTVMRSVARFPFQSRRTACLVLAVLHSTILTVSVAWSAEPVGTKVGNQVVRDQPRGLRLGDQVWFKLVREQGPKFGLSSYAKRIFLTRAGRYYVPVEEERIAIRALQRSNAGKRLLRHHPRHQTAIMPFRQRAKAPAIGSAALIRRPVPFSSRPAHLIGRHGYRHRPARTPTPGSGYKMIPDHRTGPHKPGGWQPTVRLGRSVD